MTMRATFRSTYSIGLPVSAVTQRLLLTVFITKGTRFAQKLSIPLSITFNLTKQ